MIMTALAAGHSTAARLGTAAHSQGCRHSPLALSRAAAASSTHISNRHDLCKRQRHHRLHTPAAAATAAAATAAASATACKGAPAPPLGRRCSAPPAATSHLCRSRGWRQCGRAGSSRCRRAAATATDVFALDFDGVICDSEVEVSTSGLHSCAQHWPHLFRGLDDDEAERRRVWSGLRAARPRLVKGYEVMIMARLILENSSNVQTILEGDWEAVLDGAVRRWGDSHAALAAAFERHRAGTMASGGDGGGGVSQRWLDTNPLYEVRS